MKHSEQKYNPLLKKRETRNKDPNSLVCPGLNRQVREAASRLSFWAKPIADYSANNPFYKCFWFSCQTAQIAKAKYVVKTRSIQNEKNDYSLNFIIMKKQILFLTFLVAAILTGINSSYGQYSKTNVAAGWEAPTCGAGDEYFPEIGELYHYIVDVSGPGYTGAQPFTWKVVDQTNLLTATDVGNTIYTVNAGGTSNDISITWLPPSAGNIYYLVVEYTETATTPTGNVCDINNVKVFPIAPFNAFWLDINATVDGGTNLLDPTVNANDVICAPDVSRADITVPGDINTARVTYEYGETTLQAVIHSEGYTGDFQAVLRVSGIKENQSLAVPSGWSAGAVDAYGNGTYTKDITTVLDGADELVELVITNRQYESLFDQPITIEIDGSYKVGASTVNDMSDVNGSCTDETPFADGIIQTIKARPTVNPNTPGGFVIENPALFKN